MPKMLHKLLLYTSSLRFLCLRCIISHPMWRQSAYKSMEDSYKIVEIHSKNVYFLKIDPHAFKCTQNDIMMIPKASSYTKSVPKVSSRWLQTDPKMFQNQFYIPKVVPKCPQSHPKVAPKYPKVHQCHRHLLQVVPNNWSPAVNCQPCFCRKRLGNLSADAIKKI